MSVKRYLVTGGSGFIGSALVKRLVADGHSVRVLDNNSRGSAARLAGISNDIDFVEADIRDPEVVSKAVQGMDGVFHLAYVNGTEFFYDRPELVLEIGVKGMVNVLDACKEHDVRELVLASSSEVYQTPPSVPTAEAVPLSVPDPLNPRYSYGGGKIISELMTINYGRKFFDRATIFRPHNVYGPDMGWEHVLPHFALRMNRLVAENPAGPIPFAIQGDGSETRAFVFIDDFIDGVMLMAEKGEHLGIYHIGTQEEVSIADVARTMAGHFGRDIELVPGDLLEGGTLRRCPDISKLRALGYDPKVTLADGLPKLAEWYVANADKAPSRS